ncbi:MAG: aminopeptidase P family protein [Candidatus Micrarchaeota archaeon]|nr:aminopeptidase P family protein [Candidatus Micrarchaeota archaeon]
MKSSIRHKIAKIFANAKNTDVIVLVNNNSQDPNFAYLAGYTSGVFEYDLLVFTKTRAYHITSQLEYQTALLQKHPEIKIVLRNKEGDHKKLLKRLINGKRVGINGSFLTVESYQAIKKKYTAKKMVDVSEAFAKARLIKDSQEIEEIKGAIRITKWAMLQIQQDFKEGITERQLAAKFDYISSSLGAQKPSFDTIVCFGKNAALPHHMPDETKLKAGDFILIDAGSKVNNYCSDLTRTFLFTKEKNKEMEEVYNTVKEARIRAIHAIKVGATGEEIHKVANDYIESANGGIYKGKFIHALGHSLGIEVHDGVGFWPGASQRLEAGMVITVEPGIYIEGFGGVRIEDDILITKDGAIIL